MPADPNVTRQLEAKRGSSEPGGWVLKVVSGPDAGQSFEVPGDAFVVGSAQDARVRLSDGSVSRHHLTAERTESGLSVHDAGSTNGTFYLGSRLTQAVIPLGGTLRVGETGLVLLPRLEALDYQPWPEPAFGAAWGQSAAMRRLFALADRVARSEVTVLLAGETGTGKDVLARELHARSARARGPLSVVDCGSLAPSLIESELFGHEKGAFTGASERRAGAFERARGGTVLLDELGELPLELQTRLLRAIEDRSVQRVGGTERVPIDARFIAATHRDLAAMARAGTFRSDLYYRVSVVTLRVPALRERAEDVPGLLEHFLAQAGVGPDFVVPAEARELLQRYDWPGNVRELRNLAERAAAFQDPRLLTLDLGPGAEPGWLRLSPRVARLPWKDAKRALVDELEREYVRALLERTGFNFTQAAKEAELDRNYLSELARKHGLRPAK